MSTLQEAIEWAGYVLEEDTGYNPVEKRRIRALLDAARSADAAEARGIERCADILEKEAHKRLELSKKHEAGTEDWLYFCSVAREFEHLGEEFRSLAPESGKCVWEMDMPEEENLDALYIRSCDKMWVTLPKSRDFGVTKYGLHFQDKFCPGCGRPIRTEGE